MSLPFPLGGILGPGEGVIVNLTEAQVLAALGTKAAGYVEIDDVNSTEYDTIHQGVAVGGQITTPLSVSGNISAGGNVAATGNVTGAAVTATGAVQGATVTATGDIAAAGGFRQQVGPFAVAATAASQTNTATDYGAITGGGWVAQRAGSIVGFSASLDAAADTDSITAHVALNGSEIGAFDLVFAAAGDTEAQVTVAKDTHAVAAGDVITVTYSSGATLANTPALLASVEIEQ